MKCLLLIIALFSSSTIFAQDDAYITKRFVIILSTKEYSKAKAAAIKASWELSQQLDLRELKPNKKTGLTYSKKECENEGGYPCYISRGRYDDGDYVSIEWSDAFKGFAKGYYIVVTYSGDRKEATAVLRKAKTIFKDAYIKKSEVYIGCMH